MTSNLLRASALAVAATLAPAIAPAATLPVVVVHAPHADLHLEVAVSPDDQERGLMYRTSLPPHTGMLFVFDADQPVAFWMKNTLVALDMLFVGADGTVRTVYRNVAPAPLTMHDEDIPRENGQAKYVIELPAGDADTDGITPGSKLTIPHLR